MRLRAEADPQLPAGLGPSAKLAATSPALRPGPGRSGPSGGPRTPVSCERGRRPVRKVLGSTGLLSFLLSLKQPHQFHADLDSPSPPTFSLFACGREEGAPQTFGSPHYGWIFERD